MKAIRSLFLFLGAVFALLLIAAGILGYLVTGPAPRQAGASPVEVSQEAAESLDQKLAQLDQEVAQASAGEVVSLVVTEEEVTSKLAELAADGRFGVDMNHIQVHFNDGTMCGFAIVDLGLNMQVSVQAQVDVSEGKPKATVESFNIGRLPIPSTLIGQVMNALMRLMEERWPEVPIELTDITIENGELSITAVKK